MEIQSNNQLKHLNQIDGHFFRFSNGPPDFHDGNDELNDEFEDECLELETENGDTVDDDDDDDDEGKIEVLDVNVSRVDEVNRFEDAE